MSKPYFDQISSIIKLRRERPLMDKIIRAYTVQHNRDEYDGYQRNIKFAELLNDVQLIQPNVAKAIESEKQLFYEHLSRMEKFYLEATGKPIRHLELGGWWYELLDSPDRMYLPSNEVVIEPADDYERNYSEGYGDGICSPLSNDKIKVTLEGDLTFKEALAKRDEK